MKELDTSNDIMVIHCNPSWQDADWVVEFVQIANGNYFANLWLWDDYDGYLALWKCCKTSPNFPTKDAVRAYALENWEGKDVI